MGCSASCPVEISRLNQLVASDSTYKGERVPTRDLANVKRLCLADCQGLVGEEGGAAIALALFRLKALEEVDLSRCPLGALGLMSLEGVLSSGVPKNLKTLVVSSTVDTAGGTAFSRLSAALAAGEFKQLSSLDFGSNTLKPAGAIAFAKALREFKPPLRELILPDCHIGGSGASALASALASLPAELRIKLDLFSNQIGETGGAAVGELLCADEAPRVTHLSLQNSAFGSTGLAKFCPGLRSVAVAESLEALDLSGNGIGNHDREGCAALTDALEANPPRALRVLNLAENALHYGEAQALLAALRHASGLTWLDLSHNELREDDAEPLRASLGRLASLQTLGLNQNPRLGDVGMAALLGALAAESSRLRALHVCNTGSAAQATAQLALLLTRRAGALTHVDARENASLGLAAHKESLRAAAKAAKGSELLLAGDEGSENTLGLDTRKMWFHWVGEGVFIPAKGKSLTAGTEW